VFPATAPRQHFRSQTMVSGHRLKRLPVSNHRKSPCEFSGWVVHTEYLFRSRVSSHYLFPVSPISVSVGAYVGRGCALNNNSTLWVLNRVIYILIVYLTPSVLNIIQHLGGAPPTSGQLIKISHS